MSIPHILSFLNQCPTMFHAARLVSACLDEAGFERLDECASWILEPGKGYYVMRNGSSVVAFRPGTQPVSGWRILANHLDSPALKLKPATYREDFGQLRIGTEVYGGPILNTWPDRPLGVAGRITDCASPDTPRLVSLPSCAVIPNLAIHLNRDVNNGASLNRQNELYAFFGPIQREDFLNKLGISSLEYSECELYLYDSTPACYIGEEEQLISAPHLDNLSSAYAALQAIVQAEPARHNQLVFFADNEEIGSRTQQGADSAFLRDLLERITLVTGGTREDFYRGLASSMQLSVDAAHAIQPCYAQVYETAHAPVMNRGVVLKYNSSFRYCTDGPAAAFLRGLAAKAALPLQVFRNRADSGCGSTVGPTVSSLLGIRGADIGLPLWAMHSLRETCGAADLAMLTQLSTLFLQ